MVRTAPAGPRSSADYALTTDTTDAAGQHTASALYGNDGSAGAVIGVSEAPGEAVRHGYIGQLYELLGYGLLATNYYPPEGGTTQLIPVRTADEGTNLIIPATGVTWSIVSGPLLSISPAGLVTAGAVFENTAALVRADFGGPEGELSLYVQDTEPDNFGSYAGDGLPDAWQHQYFGEDHPLAGPLDDADHDGDTNLFEYNAGLIPSDPASVFHFSFVPADGPGVRISLHPVLAGHNYTLQSSPDLSAGIWNDVPNVTLNDAGDTRTVTDPVPGTLRRYYRVAVSRE